MAAAAAAQTSDTGGMTFNLRVDGMHNELGWINRIDTTAGYRFNKYLVVDAGLPVYVVRPSAQALPLMNVAGESGIGDAHASLRLEFAGERYTYSPSLTVTAPTGSQDKGLSTGKVTWDWSNLLQGRIGPIAPYAAAGLANAVADTPFFVRPYASSGHVAHLEGGALVSISRHLGIGGSAYAIEPWGDQTVISRVVRQSAAAGTAGTPSPGTSAGRGRSGKTPPPFESAVTTTGPASIARDRGASTWLAITPSRVVIFRLGYTRSVTYALDTIFFGVGIDIGHLIRMTAPGRQP